MKDIIFCKNKKNTDYDYIEPEIVDLEEKRRNGFIYNVFLKFFNNSKKILIIFIILWLILSLFFIIGGVFLSSTVIGMIIGIPIIILGFLSLMVLINIFRLLMKIKIFK
ncbi:MAG: hypothetical protein N2Z20_04475 [Elusimicrobiales bacterium]|nr:hypothetical protein [Elusimicrobiales bacterium]